MIGSPFFEELVDRFGSPLYVYDLVEIEDRLVELRALLPESTLLYSLKANPLPEIAQLLREHGCGAEVSSEGELKVAARAAFDSDAILYTGPGKTPSEIAAAGELGVRWFSCESQTDLDRVADIANKRGFTARVLLRVNATRPSRTRLSMTGGATQFGFDEQALLAGEVPRASQEAAIVGIHVYFGTQVAGADALASEVSHGAQLATRVAEACGIDLAVADLGGGFPWPFAVAAAPEDLMPAAEGLERTVSRLRRLFPNVALWFESGRYLVASSGTLVTRVLDVKAGRMGRTLAVLDAGINVFGGMSALGRIPQPSITFVSMRNGVASPGGAVDAVGPLCTPLDVLGRSCLPADVRPGDLLAVPNVGAYGVTASLVAFLGRPCAVEVVCRSTTIEAVRRLHVEHVDAEVAAGLVV